MTSSRAHHRGSYVAAAGGRENNFGHVYNVTSLADRNLREDFSRLEAKFEDVKEELRETREELTDLRNEFLDYTTGSRTFAHEECADTVRHTIMEKLNSNKNSLDGYVQQFYLMKQVQEKCREFIAANEADRTAILPDLLNQAIEIRKATKDANSFRQHYLKVKNAIVSQADCFNSNNPRNHSGRFYEEKIAWVSEWLCAFMFPDLYTLEEENQKYTLKKHFNDEIKFITPIGKRFEL